MSQPQKPATFGYATDEHAEAWDSADGYETREAAAEFALAEWPEVDAVFVVDCRHGDKGELIDADDLVDELLERAEEAASESKEFGHYEDNVLDHSSEAKLALSAALQGAFDTWLKTYPGAEVWTTIGGTITKHKRGEDQR